MSACAAAVRPETQNDVVRVRVDPDRYAQAENVLLREMAQEPAARPASADALVDDGPPTRHEVKQLWWFCDGAIMDVGTRDHLWAGASCALGTAGCTSVRSTS